MLVCVYACIYAYAHACIYAYAHMRMYLCVDEGRKEGHVLFNDALNTFYLR